jgi:hypothetical protein
MLGREFVKRIRLLMGRTETVRTRFDLNNDGVLVEHVVVETSDGLGGAARPNEERETAGSGISRQSTRP